MSMSTASLERAELRMPVNAGKLAATDLCFSPYEEAFARSVNAAYAIGFSYARSALIGILKAAGLRAGDEVILSPLTCKVAPLALLSLKLRPVYADISAETLNLNPQRVETKVNSATRAILFQLTYGASAGVEAVTEIAAREGLLLVEDCAQCLPYTAEGWRPGSYGRAAIFSNNLLKPMPAGSGGMAVTGDYELALKIQAQSDALPELGWLEDFRLRAEKLAHEYLLRPSWYWPLFNLYRKINSGYRARPLDAEIEGEITRRGRRLSARQMREGMRWLRRIEDLASHRRLCCAEYARDLSAANNLKLASVNAEQPLYYFPILAPNKPELLRQAQARHVELIAWPAKAPIYPFESAQDLRAYGYEPGACPVAEDVAAKLVGLPTHSKITAEHRRRIISLLMGNEH